MPSFAISMVSTLTAASLSLLIAFPGAASNLPECPGHIADLELPIECMCTKKAQRIRPFNVQGCDQYAWWSNICVAAIHAGVATREGGPVRIEEREPLSEFVGCLKNGRYSADYHGSDLPTFAVVPVSGLAQDGSTGQAEASALPDCPARHRVLNEPPGDPFECMCTPEIRKEPGTVKLYGSGPYDAISNICIAAVHAGVTTREGGPVRVVPRPPQDSFEGTLANGIYSDEWGKSLFNAFDVEPVER